MQDHGVPITIQQLARNMPRHVIIDLCEILHTRTSKSQQSIWFIYNSGRSTDRNKETARPLGALEEVGKQLQPRVVAVHDQLAALGFDLREPRVLRAERGGRVRLGEVENHVDERGDRAGRDGFDAGHGDGGRGCVRGEAEGSAVA
jgi:hypothetical protein